ncbi:hypothetical protein BdWA1_000991 [Babesia duncani]|uniref:Uncharacterized protein n=1 Tax=Babesia duncani TaxID=323732 RepID=A0AAD9PGP3_9APIC|nr:hypothetical protein BdWA1_004016 [Babesia duncani]KAK2194704.1 hypothetical protein BdWA1_003835 [Babesia duncani]KAK2197987.1 hypothetical protein BdWA1_000991 [Babesia duncani]
MLAVPPGLRPRKTQSHALNNLGLLFEKLFQEYRLADVEEIQRKAEEYLTRSFSQNILSRSKSAPTEGYSIAYPNSKVGTIKEQVESDPESDITVETQVPKTEIDDPLEKFTTRINIQLQDTDVVTAPKGKADEPIEESVDKSVSFIIDSDHSSYEDVETARENNFLRSSTRVKLQDSQYKIGNGFVINELVDTSCIELLDKRTTQILGIGCIAVQIVTSVILGFILLGIVNTKVAITLKITKVVFPFIIHLVLRLIILNIFNWFLKRKLMKSASFNTDRKQYIRERMLNAFERFNILWNNCVVIFCVCAASVPCRLYEGIRNFGYFEYAYVIGLGILCLCIYLSTAIYFFVFTRKGLKCFVNNVVV